MKVLLTLFTLRLWQYLGDICDLEAMHKMTEEAQWN